jgi:high-affinity iron transporter
MFLASFLIGLREGLEAALIVSILIAYVRRLGRPGDARLIWWGVWIAIALTAAISAVSTFGRSRLTFAAQEVIGGSMSLLAVAMVTGMVFWMMSAGQAMKRELETGVDRAVVVGGGMGVFWIAFVSVGREGIETTLMLWGWVGSVLALTGIGYLLFRGIVRIDLGVFFAWSGAFLILVSAGILAYGIHDLQEAAVLPGPFSGDPITPTHPRTGEVLTGFATYPFWMAAFPFGWAFDLSDALAPDGFAAALLKGTVGFVPQMTWLEVTAWAVYVLAVVPPFVRRVRANSRERAQRRGRAAPPAPSASTAAAPAAPAQTPSASTSPTQQGES